MMKCCRQLESAGTLHPPVLARHLPGSRSQPENGWPGSVSIQNVEFQARAAEKTHQRKVNRFAKQVTLRNKDSRSERRLRGVFGWGAGLRWAGGGLISLATSVVVIFSNRVAGGEPGGFVASVGCNFYSC